MKIEIQLRKAIHDHFLVTGENGLSIKIVKLRNDDKFRVSEMQTPFLPLPDLNQFITEILRIIATMIEKKLDSITVTLV